MNVAASLFINDNMNFHMDEFCIAFSRDRILLDSRKIPSRENCLESGPRHDFDRWLLDGLFSFLPPRRLDASSRSLSQGRKTPLLLITPCFWSSSNILGNSFFCMMNGGGVIRKHVLCQTPQRTQADSKRKIPNNPAI
jgi:hypothetical protein